MLIARWDGKVFVPLRPVDLEPGTEVGVCELVEGETTWAEQHLGLKLHIRKGAPLTSDIISEERGPV